MCTGPTSGLGMNHGFTLGHLVNVFTTVTNLAGWEAMVFTYTHSRYLDCALVAIMMFASMSHHISAVNRGLPALAFESYAPYLLLFDQLMAVICIARIVYLAYTYHLVPTRNEMWMIGAALASLVYSNGILRQVTTTYEQISYGLTHGLWHILAFIIYHQIQFKIVILRVFEP